MNLYVKDKEGHLIRTENFPITSMVIGKYVSNIFYVPDEEFSNIMGELNIPRTRPNPLDESQKINNEAVLLYSDSTKVDIMLRPDKYREKDRKDFQEIKEAKARGNVMKTINKN